ncbi:hypothetical protein J2Z26_000118 [Bacillus luteolus]|nr:hypothetical protein [Cytobacillus luteolus]
MRKNVLHKVYEGQRRQISVGNVLHQADEGQKKGVIK